MTVYELTEELKKWPQTNKVIFCIGMEEPIAWFDELQTSDIGPGKEPGTILLAR